MRDQVRRLEIPMDSVIELGCHDGRLLDFIPKPTRYVGLDANWEGGLDLAREKFAGAANCSFYTVQTPNQIPSGLDGFNFGASLETLEHVPPELVDGFLSELANRIDGYFLVTVPNEIGPVFLAKWLIKRIFRISPTQYTAAEIFFTTIGRTEHVQRMEHKGFDYRNMIKQIATHFEVVKVRGFPMRFLPVWLCFGVGIVARQCRPVGGAAKPTGGIHHARNYQEL